MSLSGDGAVGQWGSWHSPLVGSYAVMVKNKGSETRQLGFASWLPTDWLGDPS